MTTRNADERLPGEPAHATSRAAVAWTLVLAVLVVVLANGLARARANPPWLSNDRRIVGTKFELARDAGRAADVVVLGDSSAAFGVNAAALGLSLGTGAINLATFGRFEIAGAAWTLDEHLAHRPADAPPRLVLAVHGARTWWLHADGMVLAQLPLEPGYWARRAPTRSPSAKALAEFALDRYAPLYVQHQGFARGLRTGEWAVPDRPAIEPDGSMAIPVEVARWADPQGFLDRTVLPELEARVPGVPERQRAGAEALAARADADGFDVVFVAAPEWEHLAEVPEHAAVQAEVTAFLTELCARHPRAHLLPGGPARVPRESVENPYHLTAEAAVEWSHELAAALRDLGLPR